MRAFYSNTGQVRILHNVECISQVSVRSIEHVRTKRTGTENNRRVQRHLKKEQLFCLYRRLDIRIMHAVAQLSGFREYSNLDSLKIKNLILSYYSFIKKIYDTRAYDQ